MISELRAIQAPRKKKKKITYESFGAWAGGIAFEVGDGLCFHWEKLRWMMFKKLLPLF
jgi:hypothetical protein